MRDGELMEEYTTELERRVGGEYGRLVGDEELNSIIRENANRVLMVTFRRRVCEGHSGSQIKEPV